MANFLLIFLGGGLGSLCRWGIAVSMKKYVTAFPLGTFFSNFISCFFLGMLIAWSLKGSLSPTYKALLVTGFCGGFSTFSTFSAESLQLLQVGQLNLAFLNIAGSVIVGLLSVWLGMKLVY